MVFGSDLSSFGAKTLKGELNQDYNLVKNYLDLRVCGNRWFQPENARFCEKLFFGSDLSSFREKTVKRKLY